MKIFRPVQTDYLFQKFGDNMACAMVSDDGVAVKPWKIIGKKNNVCPAGYKEFYPLVGNKGHNGEDWGAYDGEKVLFNVDVPGMKWWSRVEFDDAKGMNLYVFSLDAIPFSDEEFPKEASEHARNLWLSQGKKIHVAFLFVHGKQSFLEDKPLIQVGVHSDGSPQMAPEIKFGDLIMLADNTGASSGDHLHFSMKFRFRNSMVAGGDNGYNGAVPHERWFDNKFVGDVVSIVDPPIKPKYKFLVNLERGMKHADNPILQTIMKYEGLMDKDIPLALNYGPNTEKAVAAFQRKHGIFSISPGRYTYEKTRQKLNEKYA